MRKNIAKVIEAFKEGRPMQGDSKRTCWTDGKNLYSYNWLIAKRFLINFGFDEIIFVIAEKYSPSKTTTAQIRAIIECCPRANILSEDSDLVFDFKFTSHGY